MLPQALAAAQVRPPSSAPEHLAEQGYVILENLLSADHVRAIASELEPHFAAKARSVGDFFGWKTTRLGSVLTKSRSAHALLQHDAIWPVVDSVLKAGCDYIQLNLVEAIRVHQGERAQVPHRDEEMWPCDKHGAPWMINVMWALDDFTEENGATRLWPGSHASTLDRSIDSAKSIAAEMPAGSACLFMGSLTHAAGENRSTRRRTGVIVSYCLGWLKTYENQYLAYPPEIACTFAPEIRDLIGYRIHRPNLGNWNGQDPGVLFETPDPTAPFADALPPEIAEELRAYYRAAAA